MPKTGSGRIAAHVSAWARRWPGGQAGPWPSDPGTDFGGVALQSEAIRALWPNARLKVEIGYGANLASSDNQWQLYDVTTAVRLSSGNGINISPIGRSDEFSTSSPAGCTFQLDNTSGDHTAYQPNGFYYPNVRLNTPVRVSFTLSGLIVDAFVLFEGFANGFVPSWDDSANLAIVTVSASGVTRRLEQGRTPVKSTWRRFIEGRPTQPIAYWPLEDEEGSVSGASAVSGVAPMSASGGTSTSPGVQFAQGTSRVLPAYTGFEVLPIATLPLPVINLASLRGPVPASTVSPVAWTIQFVAKFYAVTGVAGANIVLCRWFTPGGSFVQWDIRMRSLDGAIELVGFNASAAETVLMATAITSTDYMHYRITALQNGSNVDMTLRFSRITSAGEAGDAQSDSRAGTLGPIGGDFIANPNNADLPNSSDQISIGHIQIFETTSNVSALISQGTGTNGATISPWAGWVGESATDRILRVCAEDRIPVEVVGTSDTAMGMQPTDSLMNLLRSCEAADRGTLYDGRNAGFGYVSRSAAYNQSVALTVDASAGELSLPFEPAHDDQRIRNKVTVTRDGGSSATFEDTDGPRGTSAVGVYDDSKALNLKTDDQPSQHAAWEVHLGTVEGFRYPTLSLDFNAAPNLLNDWLHLRLLNRIDITNVASVASQHPSDTISLLAEGWSVFVSPFEFKVSTNSSPYSPYVVGVLDTLGYLDCGASTLATAVDTSATSISVVVGDPCFWTHADGDYNIVIDGEEMTVTAVGAASSPQTLTVTRSVNGIVKSHNAGAEVHVADPFVLAL